MKYGIVGFGCAGYHAARTIRKYDADVEIVVFESAIQAPANPMLTTYYTVGKIEYQTMFPFGKLEEISETLNLNIVHKSVNNIDFDRKVIECEGETYASFDKILISSGASSFLPDLKGIQEYCDKVFLMRTPEDAVRLKERMQRTPVRNAVVVGASMAGVKVAELFFEKQAQVWLVDMAPHVLPTAAFEDVALEIAERIQSRGINLLFSSEVQEITEDGIIIEGEEYVADCICFCVGSIPRLDFIKEDDKKRLFAEKGISVNEHMETKISDIYAAGDCARGLNLQSGKQQVIGLWSNAAIQGEIAGSNMCGRESRYEGTVLNNITHFMGMDFIGIGNCRSAGERFHSGDLKHDNYIEVAVEQDRIACINIFGDYKTGGTLKNYLIKKILHPELKLTIKQKNFLRQENIEEQFIQLLGGSYDN